MKAKNKYYNSFGLFGMVFVSLQYQRLKAVFMVLLRKFKNLIELLTYFKDEQTGINYLAEIRWNGSPVCPYCEHDKVFTCNGGKRFKCAKCRTMFSVRVKTIFEDSKIPLQKWFAAIYLITSHKKGISSHQLSRDLSVTQKTAWYMLHRVRHTLGISNPEKLTGIIQADESFIGGAEANKHAKKKTEGTQGRSVKTKTAIAGIMQKGGELRAVKVESTAGDQLRPFIAKNVEFGSILHTDEWYGYNGLGNYYDHKFVKHNEKEYVSDGVHVNGMENFWSHFKRGIKGIYHSISDKHIQKYVDEYVFRYNTRTFSESNRFDSMLNKMSTTLPYKTLVNGITGTDRQMEAQQGTFGF